MIDAPEVVADVARPARGCPRAPRAHGEFPVPAWRSASAETHTTRSRKSASKIGSSTSVAPSAPLGLGTVGMRAAADGHRPWECIASTHRRRTIRACAQREVDLLQQGDPPLLLDLGQRLAINKRRRAAVPLNTPPCLLKDVTPPDPIQ